MKIILRADVNELGKRGDIIDVADGHARNYLIPNGLALKASDGAVAQAQAMRRSRDVRDATERSAAEEIARQLVPKVIAVSARAGAEGRLFGSVTVIDVVEAVEAQTGIALDRRKVHLDDPIRELGTHRVSVKLHSDVEFPVTVEVAAS
jgi:large subunit ribosomal protein L9